MSVMFLHCAKMAEHIKVLFEITTFGDLIKEYKTEAPIPHNRQNSE